MHHAAAEGAAENLHATGLSPRIRRHVVVLNVIGGAQAVEAAHNKEQILEHFDAEVAAGGQHGGHCVPGVGAGIVDLSAAQTGAAIESTDLWEEMLNKWCLIEDGNTFSALIEDRLAQIRSQEVDIYVLTAKMRSAYAMTPTPLRRLFMGVISVHWLVSGL